MVFTLLCWKSAFNRARVLKALGFFGTSFSLRWLILLLTFGLLFASITKAEESIDLRNGNLALSADGTAWVVAADFKMTLSPSLEDAVSRGLVLYFVAEFELVRPRWYWRDDRAIATKLNYRLSYHALTRQYRLSANGFQSSYANLQEALGVISRLRGWRVAEADKIKRGESAEAWLRLRLDTTQLPKPFQVSAINNRDWSPESEWKRIQLLTETSKSAQ
jgi:Domain of unknown function (DUF4390)